MKDMMAALNEMLEKRQRGEDPGFEEFMEQFGDFFPENPQNLDELLEQMARRMAAMQAMLNSMTPEQRAQLQQLVRPAARRHGPAVADATSSAANLQQMFPQMNWSQRYDFEGQDPMGIRPGDAGDAGPRRPRPAREPAAQRVEPGRARRGRHGPRPRPDGRRRRPVARAAGRAHQDARGGRPDRAEGGPPRADAEGPAARSARTRCATCSRSSPRTSSASTRRASSGSGHERTYDTKPYEFGDPFQLDLHRTIRNALRRTGRRHAGRCSTPTTSRSSAPSTSPGRRTVLMLDLSLSMPMRDNFLPAKKVAMALHRLITSQFPRDYLGHRRVQRDRPRAHRRAAARGVVGLRVRHEHAPRVHARPPAARPAERARSRSS